MQAKSPASNMSAPSLRAGGPTPQRKPAVLPQQYNTPNQAPNGNRRPTQQGHPPPTQHSHEHEPPPRHIAPVNQQQRGAPLPRNTPSRSPSRPMAPGPSPGVSASSSFVDRLDAGLAKGGGGGAATKLDFNPSPSVSFPRPPAPAHHQFSSSRSSSSSSSSSSSVSSIASFDSYDNHSKQVTTSTTSAFDQEFGDIDLDDFVIPASTKTATTTLPSSEHHQPPNNFSSSYNHPSEPSPMVAPIVPQQPPPAVDVPPPPYSPAYGLKSQLPSVPTIFGSFEFGPDDFEPFVPSAPEVKQDPMPPQHMRQSAPFSVPAPVLRDHQPVSRGMPQISNHYGNIPGASAVEAPRGENLKTQEDINLERKEAAKLRLRCKELENEAALRDEVNLVISVCWSLVCLS
jgi:hypothetical protein